MHRLTKEVGYMHRMTKRSGAMHRLTKEVECLHRMTSESGVVAESGAFAQDEIRSGV